MVMKGYIHTDDFLRAILNKEVGLRSGSIMSHVFIAENREMDRLLFIADGAMNIAPTFEQKAAILLNTVHIANAFGVMRPKVAVMAAVELINPAMPATMDAAALAQMSRRRQFSVECEVDGPFALDNAVSWLGSSWARRCPSSSPAVPTVRSPSSSASPRPSSPSTSSAPSGSRWARCTTEMEIGWVDDWMVG
jgi:phosphate butyryltransferase